MKKNDILSIKERGVHERNEVTVASGFCGGHGFGV